MYSLASRFLILLFCIVCSCACLNAKGNPPRVEIGGVFSAASQSEMYLGNYFHWGGGGRITINATRYLAGEVEATRQPTYNGLPSEVHSAIAAKGTYRAEQRRWLRFAGLNFFGVIGPAFVNHTVILSGGCGLCGSVSQRQTAAMLDWGGGFEVVPMQALAVRFDVTHAKFSQRIVLYSSQTEDKTRTYLKVAVTVRVP